VKLGVFGGSFDPIHAGHLEVALAAQRAAGLDRVLFLPTGRPPHKRGRRLAPALSRLVMVELAVLDRAGLEASAHEIGERDESFTFETVRHFADHSKGAEIFAILGSDSYLDLPQWRNWEEIPRAATLLVSTRPGFEASARPEGPLSTWENVGRVRFVEHPPHPAAATEIRRRLAAREALPAGWVDDRVVRYIEKYSLYR
jgi:nicotinate-nucleotide adenylyltransferase